MCQLPAALRFGRLVPPYVCCYCCNPSCGRGEEEERARRRVRAVGETGKDAGEGGRMKGWMAGKQGGRRNGWKKEWMEGWTDGWKEGWMDECSSLDASTCKYLNLKQERLTIFPTLQWTRAALIKCLQRSDALLRLHFCYYSRAFTMILAGLWCCQTSV